MNSSRRAEMAMAAMATLVPLLSFSHCLFNTVPVRSDDCVTAAKKQAYALIRMKVVGQQMSKRTSNPCTSDQTKKGRNEGLWLSNSRQHCFFQRSVHGKDWALSTSTYSLNKIVCTAIISICHLWGRMPHISVVAPWQLHTQFIITQDKSHITQTIHNQNCLAYSYLSQRLCSEGLITKLRSTNYGLTNTFVTTYLAGPHIGSSGPANCLGSCREIH